MNVSIAEIFTALEKNNQNTGGAYHHLIRNPYHAAVGRCIGKMFFQIAR